MDFFEVNKICNLFNYFKSAFVGNEHALGINRK